MDEEVHGERFRVESSERDFECDVMATSPLGFLERHKYRISIDADAF